MPNHVFNTLKAIGTPEAISAFKEKANKGEREFSYWNFVTPPQEALDSGEYWATNGWVDGKESGKTQNNWYEFNVREWGTKWDTYDEHVESAPKSFFATFSSAWSPPTQVFEAIVEQHPDLEFDFSWEEEQGWGGEAIGAGGHYSETNSWDIPNSHADHVDLGRTDSCSCNHEEDEDEWYDDCPRDNEEYQEDN